MVPLLVTGDFSSPKISPDLKGMLGGGTGIPMDSEGLKQTVLGTDESQKEKIESAKKDVTKQIKSLIPGFGN